MNPKAALQFITEENFNSESLDPRTSAFVSGVIPKLGGEFLSICDDLVTVFTFPPDPFDELTLPLQKRSPRGRYFFNQLVSYAIKFRELD